MSDRIAILVAVGDASIRASAIKVLEATGAVVSSTHDDEDALARALAEPFDLVVTDATTGGTTGVQLCRLLRAIPSMKRIPIVVLTATDHPRERFWSRHAGADHHIDARATAELPEAVELLLSRSKRDRTRARALPTPLEQRARLMDEMLFTATLSAEIHSLVRSLDDRAELARELVMLVSEVVDVPYLALVLGTGANRSATVHARGPWPRSEADAFLAGLGVAAMNEVELLLDERDVSADPVVGERMILPIRVGKDAVGELIAAAGHGALGEADRSVLHLVARESAIVIKTTLLGEQTRALARTDQLTGLANRRAATERLVEELERARRGGLPFAVALCDVDRFKSVNDTYGHGIGDEVLRRIGVVLKGCTRKIDLASRWGGEELLLVLTGAGVEGAGVVAERIRAAVEQSAPVESGPARVTMSIGVAASPSASVERLVERADRALYEAKQAGRNRVVLAPADSAG